MKRCASLVSQRPGWVLAAVVVLTSFLLRGILDPLGGGLRLVINPAVETLLPSAGPDWELYERARAQFGGDETILVALAADDVFTPETLRTFLRLTRRIERVDGVHDVVSVYTALAVRSVGGEVEVAPFLEAPPEAPEELQRLRAELLTNPIYANTLVWRDARTMAVLVHLERLPSREIVERELTPRIEQIVREEAGDAEFWVSGGAHVETLISKTLLEELAFILPAVILLNALVLFLGFRTLRSVVVPLVTIGIAQIWTLGTLGWLDRELNLVTTIVPPLVQTIGFSYVMHVVAEYYGALGEAGPGRPAGSRVLVERTLHSVGVPILVTAVTTAAGFFALSLHPVVAIREFGLFSMLGVGFTLLASLTVAPAMLALLPVPRASPLDPESGPLPRAAARLSRFTSRRRRLLIGVGFATLALALAGTLRVRVATDFVGNFDETSAVRRSAAAIDARLGGANEIQILVESELADALLEPANLRELEAPQDWLRAQAEVGQATSLVDYVKTLHRALTDDDPAAFTVPNTRAAVAQLLLFGASDEIARLVDSRHQFVKVHVRAQASGSGRVADLVERIEKRLGELPGHLRGSVSGSLVLLSRSIDDVARGQGTSLLVAFTAIYLVLAALFTSLRMGLRALFPNFLPIAIYFGALGFTGTTLNAWTSLVGCLALGIAVDDTIHYFARFNADAKRLGDEERANASALRTLIRPVSLTTLGLCLGFLVLTASELRSQRELGLLAAFTLATAWVIDLTLTPALCAGTRIVTLWDLLTLDLGPEPQRSIPLFQGLNLRQARVFALMSVIRRFTAGANLFREGQRGREMYVILEGTLRSSVQRENGRIELAQMSRGDTFGEVGLFSEHRTADVDALTEARVIVFGPDDLERLRRRYPRTAARVLLNLNRIQAERLARTTRRLR